MSYRRSKEEWMRLVNEYKSSGQTLEAWCKRNGVSRSGFYPYLKESKAISEITGQQWGAIIVPRTATTEPSMTIKIGTIAIDIKNGFNKEMLADILEVVTKIC